MLGDDRRHARATTNPPLNEMPPTLGAKEGTRMKCRGREPVEPGGMGLRRSTETTVLLRVLHGPADTIRPGSCKARRGGAGRGCMVPEGNAYGVPQRRCASDSV